MVFPNIQAAFDHLERNDTAAALSILKELVENFPTYSTAYLLLARAQRMDGNHEAALRALAQVRLWSSAPSSIDRELRLIAEGQLEGDASAVGEESSPNDSRSPVSTGRTENSAGGISPPRGSKPEELVEDLRDRLGPPSETADEDIQDLDSLIQRLEGARIQPEPEFGSADPVDDEDETEENAELVSETLARIYAAQKEYRAAIETYEQLARQHPDRSDEFLEKARELEDKSSESTD